MLLKLIKASVQLFLGNFFSITLPKFIAIKKSLGNWLCLIVAFIGQSLVSCSFVHCSKLGQFGWL